MKVEGLLKSLIEYELKNCIKMNRLIQLINSQKNGTVKFRRAGNLSVEISK